MTTGTLLEYKARSGEERSLYIPTPKKKIIRKYTRNLHCKNLTANIQRGSQFYLDD